MSAQLQAALTQLVANYGGEQVAVMLDYVLESQQAEKRATRKRNGFGMSRPSAHGVLRSGLTWNALRDDMLAARDLVAKRGLEAEKARGYPFTNAEMWRSLWSSLEKRMSRLSDDVKAARIRKARDYFSGRGRHWPGEAVRCLETFGTMKPPPRARRKASIRLIRREGDDVLPAIDEAKESE